MPVFTIGQRVHVRDEPGAPTYAATPLRNLIGEVINTPQSGVVEVSYDGTDLTNQYEVRFDIPHRPGHTVDKWVDGEWLETA